MTESGVTTYEINPSTNVIQVTVRISVTNTSPSQTTSGGLIYYFWNSTSIIVPVSAGPVSATSDAGSVSQSIDKSGQYYKVVKLSYPSVYYNQTRVVTASYAIPAAPGATGGFRAGSAYASLCAIGNGQDTGSVSVVVPDGFDLQVLDGDTVTRTSDLEGKQTFSSGEIPTPKQFYSCVEATRAAELIHTAVTAGDQTFDLRSWPEDTSWSLTIRDELAGSVKSLEDLSGLKMPGKTIGILESGGGLQDQGISYDPTRMMIGLPETSTQSDLTHALAHIWFNSGLLKDRWTSEGLARYAESAAGPGNYTPCGAPGAYPGSGLANLATWQSLTYDTALQESNVAAWQADAACYFFTTVAGAIGPDRFKAVIAAIASGETAYPDTKSAAGSKPVTAMQVLDLFDELGMVPAGIANLDQAQTILSTWGAFDAATLTARSSSRSTYHALIATAGGWNLPVAVRESMAAWDFPAADKEMAVAGQILALRDQIARTLPSLSLDGTAIEKQFEAAATAADLDDLLTLTKKAVDAAAKIDNATRLHSAGTNPLQAIGLLGADLDGTLNRARSDLQAGKPDSAASEAQAASDQVNGSSTQGLLRIGAAIVILAGLLLAILWQARRRRRQAVALALAEIGATMAPDESVAVPAQLEAAAEPAVPAQPKISEPPAG
ncbi:MAG TPA: hypothetical protein VF337_10460 [Candidatus Limnocylindrales bacterium]